MHGFFLNEIKQTEEAEKYTSKVMHLKIAKKGRYDQCLFLVNRFFAFLGSEYQPWRLLVDSHYVPYFPGDKSSQRGSKILRNQRGKMDSKNTIYVTKISTCTVAVSFRCVVVVMTAANLPTISLFSSYNYFIQLLGWDISHCTQLLALGIVPS